MLRLLNERVHDGAPIPLLTAIATANPSRDDCPRPPGAVKRPRPSYAFSHESPFCMGLSCGRAGRLTALFGGFRPGQWDGTGCGTRSASNPQGTCRPGPDADASSTPSAWVFEQQGDKLARRNTETGEVIVEKGGKSSGYGMRVGDWKVVVASCANNETNRPSEDDVMEVE